MQQEPEMKCPFCLVATSHIVSRTDVIPHSSKCQPAQRLRHDIYLLGSLIPGIFLSRALEELRKTEAFQDSVQRLRGFKSTEHQMIFFLIRQLLEIEITKD